MYRSAMSSSTLAVLVVSLLILICEVELATASHGKPIKLRYYVHDNFVPPGVTAVQILPPGGNGTSGPVNFGDGTAFDSPLREGLSKTSKFIGYHSGTSILLSSPNTLFLTMTAQVSTSKYNGQYGLQGRFDNSLGTWTFFITGGTGSFYGARGSATGTVVAKGFDDFVIRYDVDMFF